MTKKRAKKKAAARRAPAKRAKKRTAAKRRPSRAARKPAKKVAKRAATKTAKRRAPASKPKARAKAAKPKARAKSAKRPALRLVRRPAPKRPVPAPFAGAKAGASAKELLLFEFVRARVALHGAIQGMTSPSAETPIAAGKWTTKQIVLHLANWDQQVLHHLDRLARHDAKPVEWSRQGIQDENARAVREYGALDWEAAKRFLHAQRERLLEALESYPDEPAAMWQKPHSVEWILQILVHHDRKHADQIRAFRLGEGTGKA